jgi:HlyD family secretion protein
LRVRITGVEPPAPPASSVAAAQRSAQGDGGSWISGAHAQPASAAAGALAASGATAATGAAGAQGPGARGGRQGTRGVIYLLGADNKPRGVNVRLGITDGVATELIVPPGSPDADTLQEGATVITGVLGANAAGGAAPRPAGARPPF